jgi:hypothetical protein
MITRKISGYVWFGTVVRYLQDCTEGHPLGDSSVGGVLSNLESFFKQLHLLELRVTANASGPLIGIYKRLKTLESSHTLTAQEAGEISMAMTDVRKTLVAELEEFQIYIVTPKRLHVEKLLRDVPGLLAPGVYGKLPEIARFDFTEAGKCIAFERPTAAAFHLLRGTESVLREFYCQIAKQQRIRLPRMWKDMVDDLRKRRKAKTYRTLLDHLDHIRLNFRNPTQHPEKVYDIQEVQELWGVCADVVTRMAGTLPEASTALTQLPSSL